MSLTVESEMFGLIVAVERDARSSALRYLEPHLSLKDIIKPYEEKLRQRMEKRSDFETDVFEYLDFGDTFEIINRYRGYFPVEFNTEIDSIRQSVPRLVRIRNRIMHSRPIDSLDYETLLTILEPLSATWWSQLGKVKEDIGSGTLTVDFEAEPDDYTFVHNLPLADHSETGLVGRSSELEKVLGLLHDNRVSVVTIIGEGGIGKTALALQAAYRILEEEDNKYDAILWVSLKTERLTTEGVMQITDAISTMQEAITVIGKGIHETFDGAVTELAEALDGLNVLICLDNLETITGQEFTVLYDSLPHSCKFLVTSRRGLGQIERRFDLSALSEKDALHFLHSLAKIYNVNSLLIADNEIKKGLLNKFKYNPLAIKWLILSLSAGSTLEEIYSKELEFLEFCIKSVLDSVSASAHEILAILYRLMEPATVEEIVTISSLTINEVFDSIRELTQNGLVRSSIVGTETAKSRLQLTGTVVEYMRTVAPIGDLLDRKITARLGVLKYDDKENSLEVLFSPYRISIRSESDKAVAQILREGLRISKSDYKKGTEKIELAKNLAPDFAEVYRVEAWIRHFHEGTEVVSALYKKAYSLAETDETHAIVAFFFSQHLIRAHNITEAEKWAQVTHDLLVCPETYHLLGTLKLYADDFNAALPLLLKSIEGTTARTRMIHVTQLASLYRRWSESILEKDRNFDLAFEKLENGYKVCLENHERGYADYKLNATHAEILYHATVIVFKANKLSEMHFDAAIKHLSQMLGYLEIPLLDNKFGERISANLNILRLESAELHQEMLRIDNVKISALLTRSGFPEGSELYRGEIINIHASFGFIAHQKFVKNVYFSQIDLVGGLSLVDLSVGNVVTFRVDERKEISLERSSTATYVGLPT